MTDTMSAEEITFETYDGKTMKAHKVEAYLLECLHVEDELLMACGRCKEKAFYEKAQAELRAEVERLEKLVYVPGLLRCAKCDFRLISSVLNVSTGQVGAKNDPQQCLNGCGPMWRVTEREAGNEMIDRADKMQAELETVKKGHWYFKFQEVSKELDDSRQHWYNRVQEVEAENAQLKAKLGMMVEACNYVETTACEFVGIGNVVGHPGGDELLYDALMRCNDEVVEAREATSADVERWEREKRTKVIQECIEVVRSLHSDPRSVEIFAALQSLLHEDCEQEGV